MMLESWVQSLPPAFGSIIHAGYVAVGTFFVLSGFVLGLTYSATEWTPRSLLRYALARVARIYPVYFLSVAVMIPFILAERLPLWQKTGLVANYALLLQGWTGSLPVHWNTPA